MKGSIVASIQTPARSNAAHPNAQKLRSTRRGESDYTAFCDTPDGSTMTRAHLTETETYEHAQIRAQFLARSARRLDWETLTTGAHLLRSTPVDDEVRVVSARALTTLGLDDLARAVLDRVQSTSACSTVELEKNADSVVPLDEMIAQVRLNLELAGLVGEQAIEEWQSRQHIYHRAKRGNVIRTSCSDADLPDWSWVADLRASAKAFCDQYLSDGHKTAFGPVAIEGVNPPWLLLALHAALPPIADGYQPRFHLLQRDVADLAEGFALADLAESLARTRVFAGVSAVDAFRSFARTGFDYPMTGPVVPHPGSIASIEPPITELVRSISTEQKAAADRLHQQLVQRDSDRNHAFWQARYRENRPKRVLIPTCRYSTYIQHASRDLAKAFEDQGWEAQLLIEPDNHSRFSSIAYHRSQLDFDPDLIVLINYPRVSRPDAFPTGTPFVCWIQDAMPHLFDEQIGRAHSQRDFVFGHIYPKLFRSFGYPANQATSFPVVASNQKFHAGPVTQEQRDRFTCEMAYVSHHSETPEAMHARLCTEAGDQRLVRVLHEMRRVLGERYAQITALPEPGIVKSIPNEAWARVHSEKPNDRILGQLREQYLVPILERVLRHEMLAWAADIADRRGWSFKLFGRGWEDHPTLARFAAGELPHGDDLRAAYQTATIHLHASMSTLVHQRVMECALSGGLPVCRIIEPNLGASRQAALFELVRTGVAADTVDKQGMLGFHADHHEPLRAYATRCKQVGFQTPEIVWLHPRVAKNMQLFPCAFQASTAEQLLGELADGTIRSADQLETIVERAIKQPARRAARSDSIASRVRERFTYQVAAAQMIQLVTNGLHQTETTCTAA